MFSVFYFALAAPVAVGEILEVRSNVGILKDGIAAWDKRVDPDEDHSMGSDSDSGLTDTKGNYMEEDMELDAREKEPGDYDLIVNYDADDDNGNDDDNYNGGDGHKADSDVSDDADSDTVSDDSDDDVHGEHSLVENTSPSPEPEHPTTDHMTDLEKLSESDLLILALVLWVHQKCSFRELVTPRRTSLALLSISCGRCQ
jgi:hypothetical protein